MNPVRSEVFQPPQPERLRQLQGYRLAPFRARAGAIFVDSLAALTLITLVHVPLQWFESSKGESFQFDT